MSLLGYLAGPRVGAVVYNVAHTYVLPAFLFTGGFLRESAVAMGLALIWAAHIGVDRLLALGLKYETGRRPTHLQAVAVESPGPRTTENG